jgi:pyruvate-formate lyase
MIAQVDLKIKRSLARAETGPMGRAAAAQDLNDGGLNNEMNQLQQESVYEKIEVIEQKIQVFNDQAETLGEEGRIEEVAALLEEIEKFKKQKTELEALVDNTLVSQDKNMKVCDVCGAL